MSSPARAVRQSSSSTDLAALTATGTLRWRISSPRHQTVAVDLRGHGASPGTPDECSIERYGADVAEVMQTLALPPAVLVGHSMGCRVVVEAAMQATDRVAGVVLVDGSQFAPAMEATLKETFATPDGYPTLIARWFREMFTTKSKPGRGRRCCRTCRAPAESDR